MGENPLNEGVNEIENGAVKNIADPEAEDTVHASRRSQYNKKDNNIKKFHI